MRPLLATEDTAPFYPPAEGGEEMRAEEVGTSAVSHRKKSMKQDEKGKGNYFTFLRRGTGRAHLPQSRMQSLGQISGPYDYPSDSAAIFSLGV